MQSEPRIRNMKKYLGINMIVYISVGTITLIVIPTIVFVQMEKWTTLESVYFGKSLGIYGRFSPRIDPLVRGSLLRAKKSLSFHISINDWIW